MQDAWILPNFEVALTLLEEEAALYDDTVNISAHSEWTTTLPDPLGVPPPVANVQITEEGFTIKDNTFIRVKVTWDDPPGYGFLDHVEVWVSQASGGPYINMGKHYGSFTLETAHDEETWYIKLFIRKHIRDQNGSCDHKSVSVYNYRQNKPARRCNRSEWLRCGRYGAFNLARGLYDRSFCL